MRQHPLACALAWLLVGLAGLASASRAGSGEEPPVPPPSAPVVDLVGVLPAGSRAELLDLARTVERQTGAELAVLVLPSTEPQTIQEYSVRVFERWRIGKRGRDNGLLLVVATADRRAWITTGYGLEGILPDSLVGEVRDRVILPAFRQGEYGRGIVAGMTALAEVILKAGPDGARPPAARPAPGRGLPLWGGSIPLLVLLGGLFLVFLLLQRRQAGVRGWRGRRLARDNAGGFPPFIVFPGGPGGFWGGGGGWSGGGFGAGDFSGFGGGDTGGGGAGGEW
ncbi:MAG: TPM domain-containing protein [Deltaproteobacteria bacterium]|nr:TPM domain-containing protein [Deltaproteobacteria bacterium]